MKIILSLIFLFHSISAINSVLLSHHQFVIKTYTENDCIYYFHLPNPKMRIKCTIDSIPYHCCLRSLKYARKGSTVTFCLLAQLRPAPSTPSSVNMESTSPLIRFARKSSITSFSNPFSSINLQASSTDQLSIFFSLLSQASCAKIPTRVNSSNWLN